LLDLTKSNDELLTTMHEKTRYNIGLAQRRGVTVGIYPDLQDHVLQTAQPQQKEALDEFCAAEA